MSILETKNLIKKFDGVHAVDNLSIAIETGKVTAVIGPNGSGKTTLINTLSGMLSIDGGVVILNGVKLQKILPYDVPTYGVSRTFQDIRLFEQMTVMDNVLVVLTERGVFSSLFERHQQLHQHRVEEVLKKVGLWEKRNQLAANLSYGQRKLLEIGRVLAMDPQIVLLDEPFAGLFPEMIKIVVATVKELRERGRTIILIEHNMDLIRQLSDYVFVMDSGALLADGKPNEVLARRAVIEAYLGE